MDDQGTIEIEEARIRRLLQHAAEEIGGSQPEPSRISVPAGAAPPPWLRSRSSLLRRVPGRDSRLGGQRRPVRPAACVWPLCQQNRLSSKPRLRRCINWATR